MGRRVLLVQSENEAAQTLARFFTDRGDEVWIAWDLGQAAALLQQVAPELLLLDLHFPGDDWLGFLRFGRATFPNLKVILTNKHPDLQREIIARQNGLNVFLRQPFTRRWLERALAAVDTGTLLPAQSMFSSRVRVPTLIKISLPFLILALVVAIGGAVLISRLSLKSGQQRFDRQAAEAALKGAQELESEEERLLADLNQLKNAAGLAEALPARDTEKIRRIVLSLAMSASDDAAAVFDAQGDSLLIMTLPPGAAPGQYRYGSKENEAMLQFIRHLLSDPDNGADGGGAGLIVAASEGYFFAGSPVQGVDGKGSGVVFIGRSLDRLAEKMRDETQAEITFYDLEGQPLTSTLFTGGEVFPLSRSQPEQMLKAPIPKNQTRTLTIGGLNFTELLIPWKSRTGVDIGVVGMGFSHAFWLGTGRLNQVDISAITAGVILLVLAVGAYVVRRRANPFQSLAEAFSQVAAGNLDVKVEPKNDVEVAFLARSFNRMVAGLQESSLYRDLMGRTVTPEVREQLRLTFSSGSLRLEGQEAVATVLISNIRNFTVLSEGADPVRVFEWLNEYFGLLVSTITSFGGVVHKLDGDTMLASFGVLPAPRPPQESALIACQVALEMMQTIEELNIQRSRRGDAPLHTGIGINTGLVIAGGLGDKDRFYYTLIGDTVNTAQRLEAATHDLFGASGIFITQATFNALGEHTSGFRLDPQGLRALKGSAERIMIYRLLPAKALPEIQVML
ncbi:MAG: HAMP domain-containing protein [Anaerolineae bacterium]|nr:HAMP domain-containing protein [Anaerolineae bacterium]